MSTIAFSLPLRTTVNQFLRNQNTHQNQTNPLLNYFYNQIGSNRLNLQFNGCSKSTISVVKCSLNEAAAEDINNPSSQDQLSNGFWSIWKVKSMEMSAKLAKLGLAAVLAYGLFDAVTYTSFFILAFLGYEKSTGKNPAANLQAHY